MKIRLRHLIVAVALLAILFGIGAGLKRRSERFQRFIIEYSREANRWENKLMGPDGASRTDLSQADVVRFLGKTHWYDSVAAQFQIASRRPWNLRDPDPETILSDCPCHKGMGRAQAIQP